MELIYKLLNVVTNKKITMTLNEIIQEINRDRSEEWQNYDENDWKEGLEVFTEYKLIEGEENGNN